MEGFADELAALAEKPRGLSIAVAVTNPNAKEK